MNTNNNNLEKHHHGHHHEHHNHDSLWDELLCHLPYAIFSVALALILLSLLSFVGGGAEAHHHCSHGCCHDSIYYRLFHNFHFLHLLFSGTSTMLMFRRYSKKLLSGFLVAFFVPVFFCTLSDALIPFLGGYCINLPIKFHWCFISHLEIVLPFLLVGIINGFVMSNHKPSKQVFYSVGFHFWHIFISAMASILYLISFGFHDWWTKLGFVFVYIIIAVVVPCSLADVIVPMTFAKKQKK